MKNLKTNLEEQISNRIVVNWTSTFHLRHHQCKIYSTLTTTPRRWYYINTLYIKNLSSQCQKCSRYVVTVNISLSTFCFRTGTYLGICPQNCLQKEQIIWCVSNLDKRKSFKFLSTSPKLNVSSLQHS